MFKVGDKVVCIKVFTGITNCGNKYNIPMPIKDEIYEVDGIKEGGYIYLKGFNCTLNGIRSSFNPLGFRKVEHDFANEVLERVKEQIKQDELVTLNL